MDVEEYYQTKFVEDNSFSASPCSLIAEDRAMLELEIFDYDKYEPTYNNPEYDT